MTITKQIRILYILVVTVLLSPLTAHAGLITLSPTTPVINLNDGDVISMDILMDFTTEPTIGGGFDIAFDPSALQYQGFIRNIVGDPLFGRDPDILPGLLSGWGFGDFFGVTGLANLGSVTFQVLSSMGTSTSVSTQENLFPVGPFVSAITFSPMIVGFNSIDIARSPAAPTVPEPSTLAIFALGMLGLISRRFNQQP